MNAQIAIGSSVLLIVMAVGPVASGDEVADDVFVRIVPAHSQLVAVLNVKEAFTKGPEAKTLQRLAKSHPIVPLWWSNDLEEKFGLDRANIERVALLDLGRQELVVVFELSEPVPKDAIVARVAPNSIDVAVAGETYLYSQDTANSIYFRDHKTFAVGLASHLNSYIAGLKKKHPARLNDAVSKSEDALLVVHVTSSVMRDRFATGPLSALSEANTWELSFSSSPTSLDVCFTADFEGPRQATVAAAELREALKQLQAYLARVKNHWPEFTEREKDKFRDVEFLENQMDRALRETDTGLQNASVEAHDAELSANVIINTDEPISTLALLAAMFPRPAK